MQCIQPPVHAIKRPLPPHSVIPQHRRFQVKKYHICTAQKWNHL